MAEYVKISITGGVELQQMITQMQGDFGEKETNKVLVSALRSSFAPALAKAKQLAEIGGEGYTRPYATGELAASLRIEARKPTRRDRNSKYVQEGDAVIAKITTAPKSKLVKIRAAIAKRRGKKFDASKIQHFDGRAVAQEFGTSRMSAKPFLRPALESTQREVLSLLAERIKMRINQYRARNTR